jgi:hypothetical protein
MAAEKRSIMRSSIGPRDKLRHLQHHPFFAAATIACGGSGLAFLWNGRPFLAAAAAAVLGLAAAWVWRHADHESRRRSAVGRYADRFMTGSAEARKIAGAALMAWSASERSGALLLVGASLFIHAWAAGLLVPREAAARRARR